MRTQKIFNEENSTNDNFQEERIKPEVKRSPAKINSFIEKRKERSPVNKSVFSASQARGGYKLPPVDLLQQPKTPSHKNIEANIKHNINVLEETLNDFGIDAKVVNVEHGPTVTLYELEPAAGVKVQKISNLSDDIALVMKAHDVRIEAPIPGKGTVGVEIPNKETSMVTLREIVESEVFQNSKSKLTLGLGKDVSGNIIVSELSEMPHLLIAGATGSGKTVCVNTIVASILFNATPDEVKFIMVDPKMVELVCFNGIAHLLTPIVTDHKKVPVVLNWLVSEMENRYKILAKVAARNISQYNQKVNNGIKSAEGEEFKKLPYLVLIIDELADLMVVAGKEVEEAIGRLAHLSRAVGIHMILATQRPSVDVITGTIKSNFPARISFKVASKVDSRTVLDGNGADKLLGKGDMLFLRPRSSKLLRVQGSLVTDGEIEDMVEFIKNQRQPEYEEDIDIQQEKQVIGRELGSDELYDEAVDIVLRTEQASASMLQRRLRIGYTRAARLIDMMEQEGIVGPHRGSKAREILVNSE